MGSDQSTTNSRTDMAAANFPAFLANVLAPDNDGQALHDTLGDPGGATAYGVTLTALSDYLKRPATIQDLRALTPDSAILTAVYRLDFWNAVRGDDLPAGVDVLVADFAVVDGPSASIRVMQRVVGAVEDGAFGPATLGAVRAMEPLRLIARLAVAQGLFDGTMRDEAEFGGGWSRRIADTAYVAVGLAVAAAAKQGAST
jgi:lysozyme family protein